jgi:hypothetical protein
VTCRTGSVETATERSGPDVAVAAAAMMTIVKNQFDVCTDHPIRKHRMNLHVDVYGIVVSMITSKLLMESGTCVVDVSSLIVESCFAISATILVPFA